MIERIEIQLICGKNGEFAMKICEKDEISLIR